MSLTTQKRLKTREKPQVGHNPSETRSEEVPLTASSVGKLLRACCAAQSSNLPKGSSYTWCLLTVTRLFGRTMTQQEQFRGLSQQPPCEISQIHFYASDVSTKKDPSRFRETSR